VTRAIDAKGRKTNYYVIINKILEFSSIRNKELKVVFFNCDWFDNNNRTRQNQYGIVEVKHNERLRGHDTFILASKGQASVLSVLSMQKVECMVGSTQGELP
jgi:hypothetical protein